jgi:hypothetical protein
VILTLIARQAECAEREACRYEAWSAAIARLRADWEDGRRCAPYELSAYLAAVPEQDRSAVLQDLVAEHLRCAWKRAAGPLLEAYLAAFARQFEAFDSTSSVPADLIEDEFLARHQPPHGDSPSMEEYATRFPLRADALQLIARRCLARGRYVILRRTGLGAMGEVWEACDRRQQRLVAIKTPRAEFRQDSALRRRFEEEGRLTAGFEHPGIASVHDQFLAPDGAPHLVLQLIRGRSLAESVRDWHRAPERDALLRQRLVQTFASVCDSVAYAHGQGVLHRDLKPGNVALGGFGEAVILDWGLAVRIPPGTAGPGAAMGRGFGDEDVAGTPDYMSPEQADGRASVQSDVFGLGAILYEILTGRAPYDWGAQRPADWQQIVRRAVFPRPRRVVRGIPRALESICLTAMARDPAKRHPGAAALSLDVRRYIAGLPAVARPGAFQAWWSRRLLQASRLWR